MIDGENKTMLENLPDVSIVVTVHNSEKYLEECLYSVCNQTYENIEIICVDGGSNDNSPEILKRYACNDGRIKIVNDPNTSYGHKLNIGFELAKGKYVGILETDDRLCPDMVKKLYDIANKYDLDVVGGNVKRCFDYIGKWVGYEVRTYQKSYYNRLINKKMEQLVYAHGAIFASLYKKSFLVNNNIKVNETPGAAYQDQGYSFLTDILAKTAYYIDQPVYEYRIDNVNSSVYDNKKIFEIAWEMNYIENELKKRNILDIDIWNEFRRMKYWHYINRMKELSQLGRKKFKERFHCELKEDISFGILDGNIFDEKQKNMLYSFLDDVDFFEKNIAQSDSMYVKEIRTMLDQVLGKSLVIFGASQRGQYFYQILKSICNDLKDNNTDVKCFCDNSKELEKKIIMGKKIMQVKQAVDCFKEATFIISSIRHSEEMAKQLKEYGICEENICFYNY